MKNVLENLLYFYNVTWMENGLN